MNINDITITSLETITAFDIATGNYKFTLDELQDATIAQSQDSQEITGRQGRKLATLKRNKAVTISGTNGLVSGGLLEMQTGGKFENKSTEVLWTDYLTVKSGTKKVPDVDEDGNEKTDTEGNTVMKDVAIYTATTSWKAIGTPGDEIEALYIKNANNNTLGASLVQNATVAEKKDDNPATFTYDPSTKVIELPASAAGAEIVVYYKRMINADVLDNKSDTYSGKCALFIDAFAEDKCANVYRVQFYIPKADFSGEFSFEMGDNQTVHAFEAEALAGACGAGSSLWTYTIFGAEQGDAA